MDGDLDGMDPAVGHHRIGDLGGDGLDQIACRAGDDVGGLLSEQPVVVGVGEPIPGGGVGQIHPDRDVDDEVLALAALMGEYTVIAPDGQPPQFDTVSHR